ncbi:MAG: S8 family peptidase [Gaiellaceae bacterium]
MRVIELHRSSRLLALFCAAAIAGATAASAGAASGPTERFLKPEPVRRHVVVGYSSQAALVDALARFPARVVRRLPQLKAVAVDPLMHRDHFAAVVSEQPGITFVSGLRTRRFHTEPALTAVFRPGLPYEWQYVATRANEVPEPVLRAAAGVKIAVIDTGADVRHPDLAAKSPETWDVVRKRADVRDLDGHGTFVTALAAGSVSNNEGIAGFGGDARLLVIKASGNDGMFTELDEAAAIVYAVDHGAKVINLSLGGTGTSIIEKRAVEYAADRNVLLVAAGGNEYQAGNPIEYPAGLLQPPGSKGQGGVGLVVAATTMAGKRAYFSNTGTHISLAAPGDGVFSAVASTSAARDWPRYALPGSITGLYGWSSGTSFSTPQVTGAAALVWAANPQLTAQQVAGVLKSTASGHGRWTPSLGFGVLDVAAAVGAATGQVIRERMQGSATLKLGVWRARAPRVHQSGRGKIRRVRVSASLRSSVPGVSSAHRIVTLDVLRRGRWYRLARTSTRAAGQVRWTVGLRKGTHRLRVSYGGRWDLRGTRRHLRLTVR